MNSNVIGRFVAGAALAAAVVLGTACGAGSSQARSDGPHEPESAAGQLPPAPVVPPSGGAPPQVTHNEGDAAASTPAADPGVPFATWESPYRFERVLDKPVRSLALGRPPFAAVLSDQPWMLDASGWRELPLPGGMEIGDQPGLAGIFFGRDDKPRIMGARATGQGAYAPIYYRWRAGRWERDKREIGRLSGEPLAGLYGVLGDEDPEVVCRVGDVCIIKRRSGWKTVPARKGLGRVWVIRGVAYALDETGLSRLEADGWGTVPWSFEGRGEESGFWADEAGGLWVAVASQNAIYRGDTRGFARMASPVREPLALWGTSASDLWVVGAEGAGHYDGVAWKRVDGLTGPLAHVQGRGREELWVGGPGGLWRGDR